MAKGLEIPVLPTILILLVIGLGYAFIQGDINLPFALSYQNLEECNIASPVYASITCKEGTQVFANKTGGELINIESATGSMRIVDIGDNCFWGNYIELDTKDGEYVCSNTNLGLNKFVNCNQLEIDSGPVSTYRLKMDSLGCSDSDAYIRISYINKMLYYNDFFGRSFRLEDTENCIAQDIWASFRETPEAYVVKTVADENPEQTGKIVGPIDLNVQVENYIVGYTETAPVDRFLDWHGNPAICQKTSNGIMVQLLTKATTINPSSKCWAIPGETVLEETGNEYCCSTANCRLSGFSADAVCDKDSFTCEVGGDPIDRCQSDSECKLDSTVKTETGVWVYNDYCGDDGICVHENTGVKVACDPESSYGDQRCTCDGKGVDMVCTFENIEEGTRDCTSVFGENACCLDTQTDYTLKEAPEGMKCCNVYDGVGTIKETCNTFDGFTGILNGLGDWLGGLFGLNISEGTAIALGWIVIAIMIIIALWIIATFFGKFGFIRGGFGGRGMISQPIIIVK